MVQFFLSPQYFVFLQLFAGQLVELLKQLLHACILNVILGEEAKTKLCAPELFNEIIYSFHFILFLFLVIAVDLLWFEQFAASICELLNPK